MKILKITLALILAFSLGYNFSWAEGEERKTTDADYARLLKVLKEYKIDPVKSNVKKKDIEWWATCSNGEVGDEMMVKVSLRESVKLFGSELQVGSEIQICNGKVKFLDSRQGRTRVDVDIEGYPCQALVEFDTEGGICKCILAREHRVNGVNLKRGTKLYFKNVSPYAVSSTSEESDSRFPGGSFRILKGRLGNKVILSENFCGD